MPLTERGTFYTMGREEQVEEREVLESIFPEELTGIHLFTHICDSHFP